MKFRAWTCGAFMAAAVSYCLADDGSTAYNFLDVTSSSRVYGLGGVNISLIDDDINLVEQNPAFLGPELGRQIGINYMRYLGDSNFAGVRYGMAAGEKSAWAVAVQYFGYGEIRRTDETGSDTGTFSPKDMYVSGTFGHDITERLRGGITLKAIYSAYDTYTAFALATDLGLSYFDTERDMSLSLVITNLGGQIKRFNDVYDRLPVDVRLGWTQGLGPYPFRISVTAWNLTKWHLPYTDAGDGSADAVSEEKDSFGSNLLRHLVFGAEFIPADAFYLGLGYNYKTRTDMSSYSRTFLSGLSMCAGFNADRFSIGGAVAQPHSGATTFMFNLRMTL